MGLDGGEGRKGLNLKLMFAGDKALCACLLKKLTMLERGKTVVCSLLSGTRERNTWSRRVMCQDVNT